MTKVPDYSAFTMPRIPTGIFHTVENQDKGYFYETSWNTLVDPEMGVYLSVHTGHLANDATRGVVTSDLWGLHSGFQSQGWSYTEAPAGSGSLTIVSAEGHVLMLSAENGAMFIFDADSRLLMDGDGNPLPTNTPSATLEPTPAGTLPFQLPFDTNTPTPTLAGTASCRPAPTVG